MSALTALWDKIVGDGGPLTRADRKRWEQARTLDDLGELTALWLEGRIDSQPGYFGRVDVDEDDAPGLTAALVACNRAGYVTESSQAGHAGYVGVGAATFTQLAAVDGFASPETARRMQIGLRRYTVVAAPVRRRPGRRTAVTWCEDGPFTFFGGMPAEAVEFQFDGCSREALAAVRRAWQVTVVDPEPGRNTLWRDLGRWAKAARS